MINTKKEKEKKKRNHLFEQFPDLKAVLLIGSPAMNEQNDAFPFTVSTKLSSY